MHVWISHSADAAALAARICQALIAAGYEVTAGLENIGPGESIAARVVDAVTQADVIIAIISNRTSGSEWVASEIGMALQARKPIVPILAERSARIPLLLLDLHYLDFSDPSRFDAQLGRLVRALREEPEQQFTDLARVEVLEGERIALEIDKSMFDRATTFRWGQLTSALSRTTRSSLFFVAGLGVLFSFGDKTLTEHLYALWAAVAINVLASLLTDLIAFKRGKS